MMNSDFYRYPLSSFPDVFIHADEPLVRTHPVYLAAKSGDLDAAFELVHTFLNKSVLDKIQWLLQELQDTTIYELREKHGTDLEAWWRATFGFGYDCLTNAEAGYLLRTPTADRIRNRITDKIKEGSQ